MGILQFTIFTSTAPRRLTKTFGLTSDGKLMRTTVACMAAGTAQRAEAADLWDLARQLDALTPDQAVGWGVGASERASIVPDDNDTGSDPARISRTRRHFAFRKGPGVMMLDHDGTPDGVLDRDALRARLLDACPALAEAPMLWRPSASAGLVAPDGCELTGLHRHRLYVPVADASLTPEAGKRLTTLLWATGAGWHDVGAAGQALPRCLVDGSVWQPERLDFAAPPVLRNGMHRPTAHAHVYGDAAALFDLAAIVTTPEDDRAAEARRRDSRAAVKAPCKAQREAWAAERAPTLAAARGIPLAKAREVLDRASAHAVLMGDFILTAADGTSVAVGDVLNHPGRWHNARFADPLDPNEDRRVAVINLRSGTRPTLYSHRHGGIRFELRHQSARVQVGRGLRTVTTDAVLQVLQDRGELFDYGDAVAYVAAGRARPVTPDWLTDHLGRACEFYSKRTRKAADGGEELVELPEDAPAAVARAVLAKHGERGFKPLLAVVSAPTLRPDGSVLDVPGHDAASGLLYFSSDPNPPRVPVAPTPADALDALRLLWAPFSEFPLVDGVSRGVVLHGLLTAAVRAALPTAPGIALDAPAAGTGKTLLARCIGILADGTDPAVLPPADTDEETRKRLFSALREGARVLLWDNVREPLGCAALDSFLTAGTFRDRILGASETASLPNRALFLATGNNLRLTGDTCRRVFQARLDARSATPYARDFTFCPAQRIEAERLRYVVAALTIIRAYIVAGRSRPGKGRTASFEAWDDLVRQPICWLRGLLPTHPAAAGLPTLDDPLKAAQQAFDQDPETTKHAALLHAWFAAFGTEAATVATAVNRAVTDAGLRAALDEIGGQGQRINTRIVGRWIERHVGRRIALTEDDRCGGELRFERGKVSRGLTTWGVELDGSATENKPTTYTKPTTSEPLRPLCGPERGGFGGSGGFVSASDGAAFADEETI